MMTNIPALAFKIEGDMINLEQKDGSGKVDTIALHRLHLRHLAELLDSARCCPEYRVERALLRLWGKLSLLTSDCYLDEIVGRCGDGLTYQAHALDARNILSDILEDLRIAEPSFEDEEAARAPSNEKSCNAISPSNEKSGDAGISVTQPGRGRPATGTAMTNAERQARFRAKQADLLTDAQPGTAQ